MDVPILLGWILDKIALNWFETSIHMGDTSQKTIVKLDLDFLDLMITSYPKGYPYVKYLYE